VVPKEKLLWRNSARETRAIGKLCEKLLLVHAEQYQNWVFNQSHPTQGRRFQNAADLVISKTKETSDLKLIIRSPRAASIEELALVHDSNYLTQVIIEGICNEWIGERPDLAELAVLFAGGTLVALEALLSGEVEVAVHFAGAKHHAQADRSSGFCVFADFAIAALIVTKLGHRVAIFDLDAHHGDGTENLLRNHPVLTYSVHDRTIFPGTGFTSEPDLLVYNKRLDSGSGDSELIQAVDEFISLATTFVATMIFIAAGTDGHKLDQLSTLTYSAQGIAGAAGAVRKAFPSLPMLIGGAGGYRPDDITPEVWSEVVMAAIGAEPAIKRKYFDLSGVDFDNDAEIEAAARAIITQMGESSLEEKEE
jgi:acetoin utilization protein AcuC